MRFLVTGTAGFIGFHVARRLLSTGHSVVGVDGMTPYYDVGLKQQRHALLETTAGFRPHAVLLENSTAMSEIWRSTEPEVVIHLAGQAGVRYSLENPASYIQSNLVGTYNVLELARQMPPRHLLAASTSSVYGGDTELPFSELQPADHPLTLYAATKKATEVMGHSYAHLFSIPMTFFRFFTVYGPWGRPDMAFFKFTKAIIAGDPIDIYNYGNMMRDFTYIDDLVEAIIRLIDVVPEATRTPAIEGDTLSPVAPFRIVNIGSGAPAKLLDFIETIEAAVGKKAIRNELPMQPGDVHATFASSSLLWALTGYRPTTSI